jgi:hypothetical protein
MKRIFVAPAIVTTVLALQGCQDVGKCKDPMIEARVPVLDGQNRVMYAGQAILLTSCSSGCHSSTAKGVDRKGAPEGLDFDIEPLSATSVETSTNDEGKSVSVGVTADTAGLAGLRKRQRKVFDTRDLIYKQVIDGLMPPPDIGAGFRDISKINRFTRDSEGCTRKEGELTAVNQSSGRETLREWLACGAPIVEITAPQCPDMNGDGSPDPDGKCLPTAVAGTVGDQFPECPVQLEATFENVYAAVFEGAGCTNGSCHGAPAKTSNFDLSSIDAAYTQLVGSDRKGAPQPCAANPVPYVTPGDPDKSYIVPKCTAGSTNICGGTMPLGGALSPALLKLLSDWITAGAPGPGDGGGTSDADAGM